MRTRFVVQSPFQAMMAAEFRAQFELDDAACEIVVLPPREARANDQLRRVLADDEWRNERWGPPRTRTQIAQAQFTRRLADEPCARVVVGDVRTPLFNHLAVNHEDPWMLDDGLGVELVRQHRTDRTRPRWGTRAARTYARGVGLRTDEPASLSFFSLFDLDHVDDRDRLVRNTLCRLRSTARTAEIDTEEHLVLGSAFAAIGMLDTDAYTRAAIHVLTAHGSNATYLPHRREDMEHVEQIVRGSGARLSTLEGPIERTILSANRVPGHISSFHSTASCTLWSLLGDSVEFNNYDPVVNGSGLVAPAVKSLVARHSGGAIGDHLVECGDPKRN